MTLRLPEEVVVEQFLPTVRALLARALAERDLTQQAVADRLGVTQAAVSRYLRDESAIEPSIAGSPRTRATVERVADGLAAGEMDQYEVLAELTELVAQLEDRGPICELHEAATPALQGLGCDLCVRGRDGALEAERAVLRDVRRATRLLADAAGMPAHVPNVGTNVATALPDAEEPLDVAAVPGRLHAMRGRVNVPANPEFGASEHVAGTVLAAGEYDDDVRGGLNLATSDALLGAARDCGVDPREFDPGYEDRAARLRDLFASGVPRVLYHRGAFGIEPVTYVLGETGFEAAVFAADLVERVA
ncbi:MAG: thiamine-phosphate synthase family protein [Haloarculaceae archaeon]